MVTIVDYKKYQRENGEAFYDLEVQGGIESVLIKKPEKTYFTARTTKVPCTFNEPTCKALLGTQMPGTIKKVYNTFMNLPSGKREKSSKCRTDTNIFQKKKASLKATC